MISSAETGPLINSDSLPWKVLCCLTSEPLIGLDVDGGGGCFGYKEVSHTSVARKTSFYFFYLKKQVFFFLQK